MQKLQLEKLTRRWSNAPSGKVDRRRFNRRTREWGIRNHVFVRVGEELHWADRFNCENDYCPEWMLPTEILWGIMQPVLKGKVWGRSLLNNRVWLVFGWAASPESSSEYGRRGRFVVLDRLAGAGYIDFQRSGNIIQVRPL